MGTGSWSRAASPWQDTRAGQSQTKHFSAKTEFAASVILQSRNRLDIHYFSTGQILYMIFGNLIDENFLRKKQPATVP